MIRFPKTYSLSGYGNFSAEIIKHITGINQSANFCFLQRLSVIFGFHRDCPRSLASCQDYRPRKMASCRDCPCDSASCRDSRQEAKSYGQSLQEAISQAQQSRQEARDRGQSRRKPNMTDSLCRKRKLADSFIPCDTFHMRGAVVEWLEQLGYSAESRRIA